MKKITNSYDFGISSRCYIMIIKIEDSLGNIVTLGETLGSVAK
jgi:hypothetical protein